MAGVTQDRLPGEDRPQSRTHVAPPAGLRRIPRELGQALSRALLDGQLAGRCLARPAPQGDARGNGRRRKRGRLPAARFALRRCDPRRFGAAKGRRHSRRDRRSPGLRDLAASFVPQRGPLERVVDIVAFAQKMQDVARRLLQVFPPAAGRPQAVPDADGHQEDALPEGSRQCRSEPSRRRANRASSPRASSTGADPSNDGRVPSSPCSPR